jgi:hypothetical protein
VETQACRGRQKRTISAQSGRPKRGENRLATYAARAEHPALKALTDEAVRRHWTLEGLAAELGRDPRALGKSLLRKKRPQRATIVDLAKALGFPDPEFVARVLFRRLENGDERQIESRIHAVLYRRRIWKYRSVPPSDRVENALRSLRAKDKTEYERALAAVACVELGLERAPEHPVFPPALSALIQTLKPDTVDAQYDVSEEEDFGREAGIEAHAAWRWFCQARGLFEDSEEAQKLWQTANISAKLQLGTARVRKPNADAGAEVIVDREFDYSAYPEHPDHPLRKASLEERSPLGYVVGHLDILDEAKAAFREGRERIREHESRAAAATSTRKPTDQSLDSKPKTGEEAVSTYRRKSGKRKQ